MDDETVRIIERHLEKLQDEKRKFNELTDDFELEQGPEDWQHREMLANRLHNFYMGLEHIFERICKSIDGKGIPEGPRWHQKLLKTMEKEQGNRPPVVSESTRKELLGYLKFRHFSRRGYALDIKWASMKELVTGYGQIHETVTEEIRSFLKQQMG